MQNIFYLLFIYIDTDNSELKVPGPYQAELFGQISLPKSPGQETFWASAGFERVSNTIRCSTSTGII